MIFFGVVCHGHNFSHNLIRFSSFVEGSGKTETLMLKVTLRLSCVMRMSPAVLHLVYGDRHRLYISFCEFLIPFFSTA